MDRATAIQRIKSKADKIRSFGAAALYLFGSTARNQARDSSDIDIFIDRDQSKHVGYVELTDLQFFLEDLLEAEIDLTTRSALHPLLRGEIERTAIRVI